MYSENLWCLKYIRTEKKKLSHLENDEGIEIIFKKWTRGIEIIFEEVQKPNRDTIRYALDLHVLTNNYMLQAFKS